MTERPWRNANPGDLRTLPLPEKWFGQCDVDDAPGGPFAVFVTPTDGWRALAMNLIAYQDIHHLRTVRGIIGRFAPSLENDTGGYISLVCRQLGCGPDDVINVHQPATMMALVTAIAKAEGGNLAWSDAEKQSGVYLALNLPKVAAPSVDDSPSAQAAAPAETTAESDTGIPVTEQHQGVTTADLNDAEFAAITAPGGSPAETET